MFESGSRDKFSYWKCGNCIKKFAYLGNVIATSGESHAYRVGYTDNSLPPVAERLRGSGVVENETMINDY